MIELAIGTVSAGCVALLYYWLLSDSQEDSPEEIGFTEDQHTDWVNRYHAWCKDNNTHCEIGTCTYCDSCKRVKQLVQELRPSFQELARCEFCYSYNCNGECIHEYSRSHLYRTRSAGPG